VYITTKLVTAIYVSKALQHYMKLVLEINKLKQQYKTVIKSINQNQCLFYAFNFIIPNVFTSHRNQVSKR